MNEIDSFILTIALKKTTTWQFTKEATTWEKLFSNVITEIRAGFTFVEKDLYHFLNIMDKFYNPCSCNRYGLTPFAG